MSGMRSNSIEIMHKAIEDCLRAEIAAITAEEFNKAIKRAEERIRAETDRLALSLLSHYDIQKQGYELVIHVKKELGNGTK